MAPRLLTRKQILLKVNERLEEKLWQQFGWMAEEFFCREAIEELPEAVIHDPPELRDLVKVGHIGGTELYIHSWAWAGMDFPRNSLHLTTQELDEEIQDLRQCHYNQALRSASAGDLMMGQIYADMAEELQQFYAVSEHAGRRGLWLA